MTVGQLDPVDKLAEHAWDLCGHSETAEGSMWEALDKANYYRLGHLRRFVPTSNWSPRPPYGRRAQRH